MNYRVKLLVALLTSTLLLGAWACNQQTNYQLWTTAGKLIDNWLAVYAPHWGSQQQFDIAWTQAGQDILHWQPGTQCQNVQQGINAALGIIASVPVSDPKSALILSTAIVGAEVVQTFFVKCSPPTQATPAASMKAAKRPYSPLLQQAVEKQRMTPPKDAKELKAQYDAAKK